MALFAISDLHLALNEDKPMDIFGENWIEHHNKIKNNWMSKVKPEDTVIIAGDISWSMKIEGGLQDLNWVHNLNGTKILIKGNHDYWWTSISKLNNLYDGMNFIQNNFFIYKDYAICGTRGWILPTNDKFDAHDEKIYKREIIRLKLSLDMAKSKGYNKFIVVLHYPPITENSMDNEFTNVLKAYNVEKVIYGHLHGPALNKVIEGTYDGIEYIMTSCDYIDFNPIRII